MASPTASPAAHVFVIVMENKTFEEALRGSFTASLAMQFAVATDYHSVARPSLPNYLALTSGSTWGIRDNNYHLLPQADIGNQLTSAGMSWRAYMEGLTGDCLQSPYPYAVKHNPFAYYGGKCPANVVPFEKLEPDLASATPSFVWITPDMCHDQHDCSVSEGDRWLADLVPKITASQAWRQNGVLFVVWDEGNDSSNHVPLLVVSPKSKQKRITGYHDHYSLLATVQDRLRLTRLGEAVRAQPIREILD